MSKKVVAWTVDASETDDGCTVVFNHHGLAARRIGAEILESCFDDVVCTRSPQFDKYVDQQRVPTSVLIDSGWWFECNTCGVKISHDDCEQLNIDDVIIINRTDLNFDEIYCCDNCKLQHENSIKTCNQRFESFKAMVTRDYPHLEFTEFTGEYPQITKRAKFTFPNAKYGGSIVDMNGNGEIAVHVANYDIESYQEYIKSYFRK